MNILSETYMIHKVKKITIMNKCCIKKAEIEFKEGLNIITGRNGTGKTTIINYLKEECNGVQLSTAFARSEKIKAALCGIAGLCLGRCLIMDDELARLGDSDLKEMLGALSESKDQIIITLPNHLRIPDVKANIIRTEDFEMKEV